MQNLQENKIKDEDCADAVLRSVQQAFGQQFKEGKIDEETYKRRINMFNEGLASD